MSYAPPALGAIDFDLASGAYGPPDSAAADFDLVPDGTVTGPIIPAPAPTHIATVAGPWAAGLRRPERTQGIRYRRAPDQDRGAAQLWGVPPIADARHRLPWGEARAVVPPLLRVRWNLPQVTEAAAALPWGWAVGRDQVRATRWDHSIEPMDDAWLAPFNQPPAQDRHARHRWQRTVRQRPVVVGGEPIYQLPAGSVDFDLAGQGYRMPAGAVNFDLVRSSFALESTNPLARDAGSRWPWGRSPSLDWRSRWPWGWGHKPWRDIEYGIGYPQDPGPDPIDPDAPTPTPDIKLTYTIMNLLSIVRLPDRTPLAMRDVTIGLDVDSWAWTFSGTVIGRTNLAMIEPDALGPKDIEVTINNHTWIFMIERYTGAAKFADERFVVSGVSRTQYMADPYAPKRSKVATNPINAVQAASEELEYTGFTLDWDYQPGDTTPDWTFPAGAFAYQGLTPIEVIKAIADTAGAVVIPKKAADGWTVKPRFPVSPWAIDTAYADAIVHYSMVIDKSVQWQPAPLYDTVFISGINVGKGVEVTRAGEGGLSPGTDVFEPWLVATDVNRERGRQILAASGNHALIELITSVPEAQVAPGLIEPGDVLEYQDHSATWRGYVLAVTISAPGSGATNIKQTAKVIRFYEHG